MINRVVLVGRLSRNPELRTTPNGASVVSFTVAVDDRSRGANGERTTSFIPCVCWNSVADNVNKYTKKGSLVGVEGRINQRSYKRADGTNAQVIEIIADSVQFLGPKSDSKPSEAVQNTSVEEDDFASITEDEMDF